MALPERAKALYELSLLQQVPVKDLMKPLEIYPRNKEYNFLLLNFKINFLTSLKNLRTL